MRVLLVGTTPPGGGMFGRSLAGCATARREAGDEVEILSPDPASAAHRTGRLDGFFLAAQLARLSHRFDAIELRIETGVPCLATTNRVARAGYLLALGAALRRFGEVTIRPDTPIPIPGGLGGRATAPLWGSASRIVVWNEEDEAMMLRTPGVRPGVVEIARRLPSTPVPERPWADATAPDLREATLGVIRERAARDRRTIEGRSLVGSAPRAPERSSPSSLGVARVVAEGVARRARRLVRRTVS
jgi:hypothetical protein